LHFVEILALFDFELFDELSLYEFWVSAFCFLDVEFDYTEHAFSELGELIGCKKLVPLSNHIFEDVDREQNESEVGAGKTKLFLSDYVEEIR
jgi:hypothetical protein